MNAMKELILTLKKDWSLSKKPNYDNDSFELCCIFNHKGLEINLKKSLLELGITNIPTQYLDFMTETDGAKLFYDKTYGQAGMYLYEIEVIAKKNFAWRESHIRQDLLPTDLIIGEFFGDNDLVILRCDSHSNDYGKIVILLPLYEREEWYFLADDFKSFLIQFCNKEGIKYWEFLG